MVSPILVSATCLMLAMTKPTSPTDSVSSSTGCGENAPTEMTSKSFSVASRRIFVPFAIVPCMTRTSVMTPL